MPWGHSTRVSVKAGLAALAEQFPALQHNIAYDRMARSWNAWCTTGDGKVVGMVGIGITPADAAESLCIYYQESQALNNEQESQS